MKSIVVLFFLLTIGVECARSGPDAQFTQFYSVPLYLSPSFAGATQQQRFSASYRQQWLALPGDFVTYVFAYDHSFSKYNSGLGLMVMRDAAGTGKYGYLNTSILYSYDLALFKKSWHFRPGLSFIYSKFSLDFYKLRFPVDVTSSSGVSTVPPPSDEGWRGNVDGSISFLFYSDKIWVGSTVDHLLRPNESFYGDKVLTPVKYTFYGGAKLVSKGRLLKPVNESVTIAYQYRIQADFNQLDLGLYWFNPPIVLGTWYRGIPKKNATRGDAVAFLAGVKLNRFSFGYSYDFTVSNLINSTHGAHEFSMIYEFYTKKRKKYKAIPCPEF